MGNERNRMNGMEREWERKGKAIKIKRRKVPVN